MDEHTQEEQNQYQAPREYGAGREYKEQYDSRQKDRSDFVKDRDLKRTRFKKFDKIATRNLDIDYKQPEILQEFLTEKGKILSRLITGCSSQNQHKLTQEVKRARYIGFLPSS